MSTVCAAVIVHVHVKPEGICIRRTSCIRNNHKQPTMTLPTLYVRSQQQQHIQLCCRKQFSGEKHVCLMVGAVSKPFSRSLAGPAVAYVRMAATARDQNPLLSIGILITWPLFNR